MEERKNATSAAVLVRTPTYLRAELPFVDRIGSAFRARGDDRTEEHRPVVPAVSRLVEDWAVHQHVRTLGVHR